jgi:Protein of unknown function (DUF664)
VSDLLSFPDTRVDPPSGLEEGDTLIAFLDTYRATILVKVDGLDREALTRRMVPSHTTLLGIVKHLTLVEHWYFVSVFGGEPPAPAADGYDPNSDWVIEDDDTPESVVAAYRSACARSNEIARVVPSLDDASPGPSRPGLTMRWILVHMIDETARHAGHADILRELIDGRTGE